MSSLSRGLHKQAQRRDLLNLISFLKNRYLDFLRILNENFKQNLSMNFIHLITLHYGNEQDLTILEII